MQTKSKTVRVSGVEPCYLRQLRRFDFAQRDEILFFRILLECHFS
jgi:hypothetical protein